MMKPETCDFWNKNDDSLCIRTDGKNNQLIAWRLKYDKHLNISYYCVILKMLVNNYLIN
jgi:hypothetical protein